MKRQGRSSRMCVECNSVWTVRQLQVWNLITFENFARVNTVFAIADKGQILKQNSYFSHSLQERHLQILYYNYFAYEIRTENIRLIWQFARNRNKQHLNTFQNTMVHVWKCITHFLKLIFIPNRKYLLNFLRKMLIISLILPALYIYIYKRICNEVYQIIENKKGGRVI